MRRGVERVAEAPHQPLEAPRAPPGLNVRSSTSDDVLHVQRESGQRMRASPSGVSTAYEHATVRRARLAHDEPVRARAGRPPGSDRWPRGWSGRRGRSCAAGGRRCGRAAAGCRRHCPVTAPCSARRFSNVATRPAWASMKRPMVVSRGIDSMSRIGLWRHGRSVPKVVAHAMISRTVIAQSNHCHRNQTRGAPPNDHPDQHSHRPHPHRRRRGGPGRGHLRSSTPSHSSVGFSVRHLMVSKTKGRFADFAGTVDDRRGSARVVGRGRDPGGVGRHPRRDPRRAPALAGLPRRRDLPDHHLPLDEGHPGGQGHLVGRGRAHGPRRHPLRPAHRLASRAAPSTRGATPGSGSRPTPSWTVRPSA